MRNFRGNAGLPADKKIVKRARAPRNISKQSNLITDEI